jgi:hypothetical protein
MFSEKVRQHVTINFVPENIIVVVVGPVDRVCVEINDVIDVQSSIVMRTGNRETVRMRATRAQVVVVATGPRFEALLRSSAREAIKAPVNLHLRAAIFARQMHVSPAAVEAQKCGPGALALGLGKNESEWNGMRMNENFME